MRFPAGLSTKISLLAFPLAGMAWVLWVNGPMGTGIAHDSIFYIAMAKHIAAGKGVSVYMEDIAPVSLPIARYCPFYPLVLSIFFLFGFSVPFSVWALNGIIFAANLCLVSCLVFRFSKSLPAACLAALILAMDPLWQGAHSWVLTEGLFVLMANLSMFFLWKTLETRRKLFFAASVVFCAVASLTRYTGISYAVSGALCLFFLTEEPLFKRTKKAFLYGFVSFVPLGIWLTRNVVKTYRTGVPLGQLAFGDLAQSEPGTRSFWSYLLDFGDKTLHWLSWHTIFEFRTGALTVLIIFVLGLVFTARHYRNHALFLKENPSQKLPYLLVIYGASYVLLLIVYLRLTRHTMDIDQRYMMVFYMYLVLLFVLWVHRETSVVGKNLHHQALRLLFLLVLASAFALWGVYSAARTISWSRETRIHGADRTNGLAWKYVDRRHWFPDNT